MYLDARIDIFMGVKEILQKFEYLIQQLMHNFKGEQQILEVGVEYPKTLVYCLRVLPSSLA